MLLNVKSVKNTVSSRICLVVLAALKCKPITDVFIFDMQCNCAAPGNLPGSSLGSLKAFSVVLVDFKAVILISVVQ